MNGIAEPLDKDTVLQIHSAAIAKFGGLDGVRDEGLLESALAQPFQAFDDIELYPSLAQKAARYAYGIASNHPFARWKQADGDGGYGRVLANERLQLQTKA